MESSTISSLQQEANNLSWISMMFVKYFCYLIIPPSVVGHLISMYVFTRPSLRSNPCGMYFLFATIFGLLNAAIILPLRLIQSNYSFMDPTVYSSAICKTIWFLMYPIRSLAFWFIALACVDRYLCSSTSVNTRSWSSVRVAARVIPITILINFLAYIHVPIFFEVDIVPGTQIPVCYIGGPPGSYRTVLNFINLIFFGLLPPLCMLVFGMLTLRRINQSKRNQVAPSTNLQNPNNRIAQKKDRQIRRMVFIQFLVYSVTGLIFSVTVIITTVFSSQSINVFEKAQEAMANSIVGVVSTIGPCLSFYLFTLSSSLFRKEIKDLFKKLIRNGNQSQEDQRGATNTRAVKKTAIVES